jgi:hypothetical protein
MDNSEEIAQRIADIIISPDSAIGLVHGILSMPVDLGYLAYGLFDTESYYAHETETIRIIAAIKRGILNHDRIIDAIQTIFNDFNKYVSESQQNKTYSRSVFSAGGRIATNTIISGKLAAAIAQGSSFFVKVRGGVIGNILLVGGMKERCIRTAEKLSVEVPELYAILRLKDYDLLYFLFEPALSPFVDALSVRRQQGSPAFDNILKLVDSKVGSRA